MTVEELIQALGELPADSPVSLEIAELEAEEFVVTTADDGWVVLSAAP